MYEAESINKKYAACNDKSYEPLYTPDDVAEAMKLFEIIAYNEWVILSEDIEVMFLNSGHLIGSTSIYIKMNEEGSQTIKKYTEQFNDRLQQNNH